MCQLSGEQYSQRTCKRRGGSGICRCNRAECLTCDLGITKCRACDLRPLNVEHVAPGALSVGFLNFKGAI